MVASDQSFAAEVKAIGSETTFSCGLHTLVFIKKVHDCVADNKKVSTTSVLQLVNQFRSQRHSSSMMVACSQQQITFFGKAMRTSGCESLAPVNTLVWHHLHSHPCFCNAACISPLSRGTAVPLPPRVQESCACNHHALTPQSQSKCHMGEKGGRQTRVLRQE